MKQLFKTGAKKFVIVEVPAPGINGGEVLIEVYNSLISSGTETMGFKKDGGTNSGKITKITSDIKRASNFIKEKGTTELLRKIKSRDNISSTSGYSVSGVVIAKGKDVNKFEIGDRVAAAGSGIAPHAEIVAVPKNLAVKLPDEVEFTEGAFTTIGSIALQGVRQAKVQAGENVVVIGLGLIGLITVQILQASGCRVIGIDINQDRVRLAEGRGMDFGLVAGENDVVNDVIRITSNLGADSILITAATSSSDPANQAMQMARKKGRVVVVGAVGMELNRSPFYEKELEFTISCSYGPGRYDTNYEEKGIDYPAGYVRWTENRNMEAFIWMLSKRMVDVNSLISDEFDIDDAPSAFEKIISDPQNTLGVLLNYPSKDKTKKLAKTVKVVTISSPHTLKDVLNIAVIGAGGFASRTYLPEIYKSKQINLKAVATKTGKSAKKIASDFSAEYCTTDYHEILNDSSVDAVIIASRHNLHYPMAYDAIMKGKHVLLEKPMGMDEEEIKNLVEAVEEKNIVFSVGYNRRYSPLSVKSKNLLQNEQGPILINYRVNAGFIPLESWVQDRAIGGGRIIGEACHFYDLFNFFIDSEVTDISVDKIDPNQKTVIANDNFANILKYKNGSIAVLTYSSLGNKELPKEYIEIFVNGKSIVIDDFKELRLFGFKGNSEQLKQQNKGQKEQLYEFLNKIRGGKSSLLTVYDAATAARISIQTDEMVSK